MKMPSRMVWVASVLIGACFACSMATAQSLEPADDQSPGMRQLPPIPGGGPDPYSKYKIAPSDLAALREQALMNAELRQKQLTDAANLLLKIARELQADVAAHAQESSTPTEIKRLKQIQKLSRLIQEKEKAQDPAATKLARAGQVK